MKHKKLLTIAALAFLLVSLIVGGASVAIALSGEETTAQQAPPDLDKTSWTLHRLDDRLVISGSEATLVFEDGQVRGNASCNRFFGPYERDGERLSFGVLATTRMACPDMDQEMAYLAALASVTGYEVTEEQLILSDADGKALLVLEPERPASLTSSAWRLIALSDGMAMVDVLDDTQITATFDDGRVAGSAGCNSYFGSFSADADRMTIGPAGSTEMFCAQPEGLMDQEQAYLVALGTVDAYAIEGDTLTIYDASGNAILQFTVADN